MCHPDLPRDAGAPDVPREEAVASLRSGEEMPGLLALPDSNPLPPC